MTDEEGMELMDEDRKAITESVMSSLELLVKQVLKRRRPGVPVYETAAMMFDGYMDRQPDFYRDEAVLVLEAVYRQAVAHDGEPRMVVSPAFGGFLDLVGIQLKEEKGWQDGGLRLRTRHDRQLARPRGLSPGDMVPPPWSLTGYVPSSSSSSVLSCSSAVSSAGISNRFRRT